MNTIDNTVTYLNHFVNQEFVAKIFSKFSIKYGKLWTTRLGDDADWIGCLNDWVEELSKFTVAQATMALNKCFIIYKEFPPTQMQLIDLCLKETGLPELGEVIRLLIARDFSHPLVKMLYDKIGGWSLSNGKEYEIKEKIKEIYPGCLADFTINPEKSWAQLNSYKDNLALSAPEPTKIPSPSERKCFSERMAEYQKKLAAAKNSCEGESYRHFDEDLVTPTRNTFDAKVYEEFKSYLLSIPYTKVMILPTNYIYQRMRFIAQREQPEILRHAGFNPNGNSNNENTRKDDKQYKSWNN